MSHSASEKEAKQTPPMGDAMESQNEEASSEQEEKHTPNAAVASEQVTNPVEREQANEKMVEEEENLT